MENNEKDEILSKNKDIIAIIWLQTLIIWWILTIVSVIFLFTIIEGTWFRVLAFLSMTTAMHLIWKQMDSKIRPYL